MAKKKNSFSGSLGFVLAAAGSAVGVGNIWRFPYLCAKDGGGLFLLVYLVLVATFGFVLLTTDVAIGRRTKENALQAFGTLHPKWKFVGYLTFLVPMLIMTYYSVIGGWITKYFFEYLTTSGRDVAEDGYFTSFITEKNAPLIFTGIFLALTIWVVSKSAEGTYGYKITQDVRQAIEISESTLYPVLRRLQKDDCLETYDRAIDGRNRRYYKITEAGRIQLNLYRGEWNVYAGKISEILKEG